MNTITYLLKELNFTESEAKVYVALLENGVSTGYEASKSSGVASSKIYNVLESLLKEGAIAVSRNGKSTLYRAEPIENLAAIIRSRVDDNLRQLQEEARFLTSTEQDEHFWHLSSWDLALAQAIKMIREANVQIAIQIWVDQLDPQLEACLIRKQAQMDNICMVLYDEEEKYETSIPRFYRHGFEEDKLDELGGKWLLVETDTNEMLYAAFRSGEMVEAFHTRNRYMAMFAREYVFHDAYCLRLIDRLHGQVASEFGRDMKDVRNIFSP